MLTHNYFWLKNVHIPTCLLANVQIQPTTRENLALCDLKIEQGKILEITPAKGNTIGIDLQGKI